MEILPLSGKFKALNSLAGRWLLPALEPVDIPDVILQPAPLDAAVLFLVFPVQTRSKKPKRTGRFESEDSKIWDPGIYQSVQEQISNCVKGLG